MKQFTEIASNAEMAGWTADSIKRIIAQTPIVQISRIDEYGCVWFDTTITGPDGTEEEHSLTLAATCKYRRCAGRRIARAVGRCNRRDLS